MQTSAQSQAHPLWRAPATNIKERLALLYDKALRLSKVAGEQRWLTLYQVTPQGPRPTSALSYPELIERASVVAGELQSLGLERGERVLLSMRPHEGLYISHVACLLAELTPVIFHAPNAKQTVSDFKVMFSQHCSSSQPRLVLSEARSRALIDEALAGSPHTAHLCFEDLSSSRERFSLATLDAQLSSPPTEVAFLQYSSGTTGAKKGVIFKHQALLSHLKALSVSLHLSDQDVIASWLPLYHDMGFIACWLLPLLTGVRLSTLDPHEWVRQPKSLFELTQYESATLCWLPNFAFSLLTERVKAEEVRLSSLRALISCSEVVSYEVMRRFAERFDPAGLREGALSASYAMAENIFAVTQAPLGEPLQLISLDERALEQGCVERRYVGLARTKVLVSSGRPLEGVRVLILNEGAEALPEGEVGRVAYESETLFGGYLVPEGEEGLLAQDERVSVGGKSLYLTQDLGFMMDGELYVLGRRDDVMILGGKNIYPYDIEALLNEREALIAGRLVAVKGAPQAATEGLVILAETHLKGAPALSELALSIKQQLTATLDVPVFEVLLLPHMTLSKSTSGKLSRGKSRARYLSGELKRLSEGLYEGSEGEMTGEVKREQGLGAEGEVFKSAQEALARALKSSPEALTPSLKLFSSALLDSFNAHLFLDELTEPFGEALIEELRAVVVELDELGQVAAWLTERLAQDERGARSATDQQEDKKQDKKEDDRFLPKARWLLKSFKLHQRPDDEMQWLINAARLANIPGRRALQGGGWLEARHVRTPTISTNELGCRETFIQGEAMSLERWFSSTEPMLIIGDSAAFGVGVRDNEVLHNQLCELNPQRLWLNLSARGARFQTITSLLDDVRHELVKRVVIFGAGDFKGFDHHLKTIHQDSTEETLEEVWSRFSAECVQDLRDIHSLVGEKLILVHPPRLMHAPRAYQVDEAETFWSSTGRMPAGDHVNYFGMGEQIERYMGRFEALQAELCEELGVPFLSYASDPFFNIDEQLYLDSAHYTPLMHSLLAIKLNEDLNRFM